MNPSVKIEIPETYRSMLQRLEEAGFESYLAGGCVRDAIMGITPHDYDITTSALPQQVTALFKTDCKVIPTGIQHGTVTVICNGAQAEITTFRTDGKYADNRHPTSVSFSTSVAEDTKRRDFTVNAMCYSHIRGFVDNHGGIDDINNKLIRCVGNPNLRFEEDALRILRALRFSARLGFDIEQATAAAMLKHRALLDNIARERILSELKAFFSATYCCGLLERFSSVIAAAIKLDAVGSNFAEISNILSAVESSHRLAAFFALCGGSIQGAKSLMAGLKPDSKTALAVDCAAKAVFSNCFASVKELALTVSAYGVENAKAMLALSVALNKPVINDADNRLTLVESGVLPLKADKLAINGTDILTQGIAKGANIGAVLNHLFLCVHDGTSNTVDALLAEARAFAKTLA